MFCQGCGRKIYFHSSRHTPEYMHPRCWLSYQKSITDKIIDEDFGKEQCLPLPNDAMNYIGKSVAYILFYDHEQEQFNPHRNRIRNHLIRIGSRLTNKYECESIVAEAQKPVEIKMVKVPPPLSKDLKGVGHSAIVKIAKFSKSGHKEKQ